MRNINKDNVKALLSMGDARRVASKDRARPLHKEQRMNLEVVDGSALLLTSYDVGAIKTLVHDAP